MSVNRVQMAKAITSNFQCKVKGLYPYQVAGVEYITQFRKVLLSDDMGTGKSLQCIAAAAELNINYLIICPATLRRNWQNEIRQWTGVEAQLYERGQPIVKGVPLIATYGQAAKHEHAMRICDTHDFKGLILDEVHAIKHRDSARAQRIMSPNLYLSKAREMLVCVTGTPIENRPAEIWTLLKILGVVKEDYWQFGMKYAEVDKTASHFQKKMVFGSGKNHEALRQLLLNSCLLRRTKGQVLPHLPPKVYRNIVLEPDGTKLIKRELALYEKQHLTRSEIDELKHIRAQLAVIKAPHVAEYCIEALASSPKIIVFAWHRSLLTDLWCSLAGFGAEIITGGTPTDERQKRVARFQTDPNCRVFVASISAAGVGITLTASSHVIMGEMSWKPGENEQALDRSHRVGQRNSVLCDFLMFPNSADERVARACKDKQNDINKILS
jgi:SWI/SNF-related matrix-associated actin-dependent regulator of chromatin subfamily A-like protein 1